MRLRLLVFILGLGVIVHAQTTPNINFNIPAHGTKNWDVLINSNFSLLDSYLSGHGALPGNLFNVATNATDTNTTHALFSTGNPSIYISRAITVSDLPSIIPTTSAGIVALFSGCSGSLYLGADGACHNGLIPTGTIGFGLAYSSSSAVTAVPTLINTSAIAGADIVAQMKAARLAGPEIYIPAGSYTTSSCTTWGAGVGDASKVGVLIPSGTWIHGAGQGVTTITVNRGASDPTCALFENSTPGSTNSGIRISDLTIAWNENASSTFNTLTTPIFLNSCVRCEVDHVTFTGTADREMESFNGTAAKIHDNTFIVTSGASNLGNSGLGVDASSATTAGQNAGIVGPDNQFFENGSDTAASLLVVTQSNLAIQGNVFNIPGTSNINPMENGQDSNGNMVQGLTLSGNVIRCSVACSLFGPVSNSTYSHNDMNGATLYLSEQAGVTVNTTGLRVLENTIVNGYISIGNVVQAGTYLGKITVKGNIVENGAIATGSSGGGDVAIVDNFIRYGPATDSPGISCNGICTEITNNTVKNVDARVASGTQPAIYVTGSPNLFDGNKVIDDQQQYSTGTACSVASVSSTTCTGTATYWVHVAGGSWSAGWTNRCLFVGSTCNPISGFPSANYIQLETPTAIAASTAYTLKHTTYDAYEFGATSIKQFTNNSAVGTFNNLAAQFDSTPTWSQRFGNSFDISNGTCAMSSSTTCTFATSFAYAAPICMATQQSAGTVIAGECSISGTTVTITAASSNSATWAAKVFGNPN